MVIYKISNTINDKVYIGLTCLPLNKRWIQHKADARRGNTKPLYRAMRKYGLDKFYIEQIDSANTLEELGEKERYYIALYHSISPNGYNLTHGGERNQLDANPRAKLSVQDVVEIRNLYETRSIGVTEAYEKYRERISFSAFEKIWEGQTWVDVHMDVYTKENKTHHRTVQKTMPGENNGNALLTDAEIMKARMFYVDHTLEETYSVYGQAYKTKDAFRSALTSGYKHLPVYKKRENVWKLDDQIIRSNPVSTIPESGE